MTIQFGYTVVPPNPVPKKKRSFLTSLTLLFVVSYALMTMLIVEQGAAIQSQSNLIKILMPDSRELWALKGKAISDKAQAQAQKQAHSPSTQAQVPAQTPSTQGSQHQNHTGKLAKPHIQLPPVPASDLGDQRRAVRSI